MTTELRARNQSQQLYVRALSTAWRNGVQIYDPSLWLLRDPELEEKMLRDADIAAAVSKRRMMIAGQQWSVLPKVEKSPRAPVAVAVASELLDNIERFFDARVNLARAFFSGSRFARIHLEAKVLKLGDGKPRTWLVPVRLEDMDKRYFRIVPKFDQRLNRIEAHWERWNLGKQVFEVESAQDALRTIRHVYQDDQGSLGHGRGLREALGWWWYAKEHVFQESLQAVERFAQGILTAKVDGVRDANSGKPNTELITAWRDVLTDLRARNVLVYDSADQVEVVNMNGEGWQLLKTMRDELRATIATLILAANLPTQASEGGSYALSETQADSTETLIKSDREALEETLTRSLIGCLWHYNWINIGELQITEEQPKFSLQQESVQDPKMRADVANVLHGMGVDLSKDDVLDQTGFRKPEEGEDVIPGAAAPTPGMDPAGVGGGSLFPFRR
jgi:hypothetical protein